MASHTPFRIQINSASVDETRSLGITMGRNIHDSTIIYLSGDLGSGKTVFVQGLAKGLDVLEDYYITSPTYTLLNEYPGRLPLYHFDFYRLDDTDDIDDTGFYETLDTDGVIAVEWAERLPDDVRTDHIWMEFIIENDTRRQITMTATGLKSEKLIKKINSKNNN